MNLKTFVFFCFTVISVFNYAQQINFLEPLEGNQAKKTASIYLDEFEEFVDTDEINGKIEILYISFSLDPSVSDKRKEKYIQSIIKKLEQIASVNNSKLKGISFSIGEQVFLSNDEVLACGEDFDKMAKLNVEKAWQRLSPTLMKNFPKVKFYGKNYNW